MPCLKRMIREYVQNISITILKGDGHILTPQNSIPLRIFRNSIEDRIYQFLEENLISLHPDDEIPIELQQPLLDLFESINNSVEFDLSQHVTPSSPLQKKNLS